LQRAGADEVSARVIPARIPGGAVFGVGLRPARRAGQERVDVAQRELAIHRLIFLFVGELRRREVNLRLQRVARLLPVIDGRGGIN
jgi:hypothetical protein